MNVSAHTIMLEKDVYLFDLEKEVSPTSVNRYCIERVTRTWHTQGTNIDLPRKTSAFQLPQGRRILLDDILLEDCNRAP